MRILRTSAALGAAALAGLVFGPVGRWASRPAPARHRPDPVSHGRRPTAHRPALPATPWTQTTPLTSVSTAFTLPTLTCPATGSLGVLSVAELANSTAHTAAVGGVLAACRKGAALFQPFVFIDDVQISPAMSSLPATR